MSLSYESFGKYILLEKLAVGGMAEIYLARSTGAGGVGKFVAIKRILPQFTEQTEFIDMFKDEAKIAVNLSHANVVSIYEFGLEKNSFFLAMDYIEGRNLRQILNKMKKSSLSFSIEQVLYIIKEVAGGLDHAHRCIDANTGKPLNIIHRDMSPQNVMVSFEGEVKIVDFGIAKAETQLETTRAGTLKGKFGYMSPEQAEGQPVDLRTDVFALGIVLWELLANDRLFVANNEVNTLRKIRDCQIPSLRKINPNIAPELERIVGKALAKDRNLRYQTAAAFHRDLSRFLNRQYPDFSPQDFSVFVKTLFAGEILESRKKMVDYAKIDIAQTKKDVVTAAPPQHENTVITNTQETQNTGSDVEEDDISNSGVDFENPDHKARKAAPAPAKPTAVSVFANPAPAAPAAAAPTPASALGPGPTPTPTAKAQPAPQPKAPPREAWQQPPSREIPTGRELPKQAGQDAVLNGRLAVDRSAFRNEFRGDGSFANRTVTRSRANQANSSSKFMMSLVFFGLLAAAGAFYLSNPKGAKDKVQDMLVSMGALPKPPQGATDNSSTKLDGPSEPRAEQVDIYVASAPSGAPIEVDGVPTGEVTPATIKLEKNRKVKLTVKLAGYLPNPYEEYFKVEGPRTIDVKFKGDVKGFLNVIVKGEGQIYVNNKLVASTSPARMIAVPANESIDVSVFDPKTRALDKQTITVGEGSTETVVLTPRAAVNIPVAQPPRPGH